jgi:hypothetical protein
MVPIWQKWILVLAGLLFTHVFPPRVSFSFSYYSLLFCLLFLLLFPPLFPPLSPIFVPSFSYCSSLSLFTSSFSSILPFLFFFFFHFPTLSPYSCDSLSEIDAVKLLLEYIKKAKKDELVDAHGTYHLQTPLMISLVLEESLPIAKISC